MGRKVKQVFFNKTTTGTSSNFTSKSDDLRNPQSNNVGIFVYGNLNGGLLKLQAKPIKTNEEVSPSFTDISDKQGIDIVFAENSLSIIEMVAGLDYRLSFSGSGANFSTQIIYD